MATLNKAAFEALYGTSGTTFPDNTTGEISESDMRQFGKDIADSFQLTQGGALISSTTLTTTSAGGAQTILTIPRTTNKNMSVWANCIARWVSGGGGAAGDYSHYIITAMIRDVAGTGTLVGGTTDIKTTIVGAEAPTFSFTVSGTNIIIQANCSSGVVYNVKVTAETEEI